MDSAPPPPHHILIVDDEKSVALVLATSLARLENCRVETAQNGAEALAKFGRRTFHLVITDYRMPDMTGVELARQMRLLNPQTQVILMSAFGTTDMEREAHNSQIVHYLEKPVSVVRVREVAARLLKQLPPA